MGRALGVAPDFDDDDTIACDAFVSNLLADRSEDALVLDFHRRGFEYVACGEVSKKIVLPQMPKAKPCCEPKVHRHAKFWDESEFLSGAVWPKRDIVSCC